MKIQYIQPTTGAKKMSWENEINTKSRFEFGANWASFLMNLSDKQIEASKNELKQWFACESLEGKAFLDIGSGSGIHSLAAKMLGATVYSFDYDDQSVSCAKVLKERYFKNDENWTIEQGSALDRKYLESLGKFDIVYSWGVLHHTGDMWKALENAAIPLKDNGELFVAIYNTQVTSGAWTNIKKTYVSSPKFVKKIMTWFYLAYFSIGLLLADLIRARNPSTRYQGERGMKFYFDVVDWIGGYPFETAKPEEIFDFYHSKGFTLKKLKTVAGKMGCNEFLFTKS